MDRIGTVEVTNVFKAKVVPAKTPDNPTGEGEPREMVGSKLLFLPDDPHDNWSVRGEITVPGPLPFGKVYDIVLVERVEKHALQGDERKFQEKGTRKHLQSPARLFIHFLRQTFCRNRNSLTRKDMKQAGSATT